jgi:hypothetical protein
MGWYDIVCYDIILVSGLARAILEEIVERYLSGMGVYDSTGGTADVQLWIRNGVPGSGLENMNSEYWYYHHTEGLHFHIYRNVYYCIYKCILHT